jgi:hypothetical protein
MRRLHASLPFPLTGAQQRVIAEIAADLASPRAMNRLLHGDVGSGKTLVALSAMLLCVESGHQAAIMAPRKSMAEQHYLNFRRLLEPLGLSVALRTGARAGGNGDVTIVCGGAVDFGERTRSECWRRRSAFANLETVESTGGAQYARRRRLPHFEKPWAIYAVTFSTKKPPRPFRKITYGDSRRTSATISPGTLRTVCSVRDAGPHTFLIPALGKGIG